MRRTVPALSLTRGSAVRRRHGEQAKGLVFGEHQQRDHKQIRGSFPFDPIAIVAQVMQSDAYFEKKDCQMATGAYEDFVNSNPDDENAAHALRQLGEGYEEQTLTINRDHYPEGRKPIHLCEESVSHEPSCERRVRAP